MSTCMCTISNKRAPQHPLDLAASTLPLLTSLRLATLNPVCRHAPLATGECLPFGSGVISVSISSTPSPSSSSNAPCLDAIPADFFPAESLSEEGATAADLLHLAKNDPTLVLLGAFAGPLPAPVARLELLLPTPILDVACAAAMFRWLSGGT